MCNGNAGASVGAPGVQRVLARLSRRRLFSNDHCPRNFESESVRLEGSWDHTGRNLQRKGGGKATIPTQVGSIG